MKIGIMGGTFDPIHNGHLMLGEAAYEQFDLDEVWFMPNGNPPHKKQTSIQSDARHRAQMVKLAIDGKEHFRLEEYEVLKEGVSCSYQTMEHFRAKYETDTFYFIIGADSLYAIETWVHPERLFPNCIILAACRDEIGTVDELKKQADYLYQKFGARIQFLNTPLIPVASSELRIRMRRGESIKGLVPDKVEDYIAKEGLYEPEYQ